jgi:hypothetical protein
MNQMKVLVANQELMFPAIVVGTRGQAKDLRLYLDLGSVDFSTT